MGASDLKALLGFFPINSRCEIAERKDSGLPNPRW
jgi:hypothetical protein